jgi:protein MpaA
VIAQLARSAPPRGICLWLLASLDPDGQRRGTRHNARGVDLNRNFPFDWRGGGRPFDTYFPGRARASEPETRAALAMIRSIRPDVTIWYHQHLDMVIRPPLPWRQALARAYERTSRLPMRSYPGGRLHGTASAWQHTEQPRSAALVVELPAGRLPAAAVRRHVAAVRAVGAAAAADAVTPTPAQ